MCFHKCTAFFFMNYVARAARGCSGQRSAFAIHTRQSAARGQNSYLLPLPTICFFFTFLCINDTGQIFLCQLRGILCHIRTFLDLLVCIHLASVPLLCTHRKLSAEVELFSSDVSIPENITCTCTSTRHWTSCYHAHAHRLWRFCLRMEQERA